MNRRRKYRNWLYHLLLIVVACVVVNVAAIQIVPVEASQRALSSESSSAKSSQSIKRVGSKVSSGNFSTSGKNNPTMTDKNGNNKVNSGNFSTTDKQSDKEFGGSSSSQEPTYMPWTGGGYDYGNSFPFWGKGYGPIPQDGRFSPLVTIGIILVILLLAGYYIWSKKL